MKNWWLWLAAGGVGLFLISKASASTAGSSSLRLKWYRTSETPPVFQSEVAKRSGSLEAYKLMVGQYPDGKWGLIVNTVVGQVVGKTQFFDSQDAAQQAGEDFIFKP